MTTTAIAPVDEAELGAFVHSAVVDMGAAISGLLHIRDRLGLYQAMAGAPVFLAGPFENIPAAGGAERR